MKYVDSFGLININKGRMVESVLDRVENSTTFEMFKSDHTLLEHLPHAKNSFALSNRNFSLAHINTGELKHFLHAIKLVCYLLTVTTNLSAEFFKTEGLWDFNFTF